MAGPWRIKEFAARTGVPEVTLRAWERRYGLLEPTRTAGGYRLYTDDDERRVAAMQAHMGRGIAAGDAARLVRTESPLSSDLPSEPEAIIAGLFEAIAAYDAMHADQLLEAAFALGPARAIGEVVIPMLHEVGERWERNELTVAHEHFISHLVERRLMQHAGDWQGGQGQLALLACPSGEQHTLGLLSFGVALADRGWRIAYLGGDLPIGQVVDAAASLRPDAIVLCATDPLRLTDNAALIRALRAHHRTLVAGAGATEAVAGSLGVERLAEDPVASAAAL